MPFRCFRIHVLMCVVFKLCVSILAQTAMTAVSPMSGALTFDTGKRHALRAGRVMMIMVMTMLNSGNSDDERC